MCTRDLSSEVYEVPAVEAPPEEKKPSKQLERFKHKHNIVTDPTDAAKQREVAYQPDLLAVSTQYTKLGYDLFKASMERLQETKAYV